MNIKTVEDLFIHLLSDTYFLSIYFQIPIVQKNN